jgi:cell division transport system permease protein
MLADERVEKTRFVTKDENLRSLFRQQGWDTKAIDYLDNPLPDCLIVHTRRPEDVPAVGEMASRLPGVAGVHYAQEVTTRLLRLIRGVKLTGAALSVVLAAAALVVVATTIRLTVYARRREIRIMQLVGATHWFIRLPFLLEGAIYGAASGVVSAVLLLVGYAYLDEQVEQTLPFVQLVFSSQALLALGLGIVAAGVLFGFVGSVIATREYLREV